MKALLKKVKYYTFSNINRRINIKRLKTVSPFDNFQLPAEFDETIYKNGYKDLFQCSNNQLYAHYKNQGEKEGRRSHALKDRIDFIKLIPANKKVLEIGPFFSPLMFGKNVTYFDILNQADLILRAKSLGVSRTEATSCPKIDFVSPTGDLDIVNEKFDVVLSSHCIEHQPNLIKHLNSVARLLKPGGFYFLLIPDKRYCFDHFIPESNLAEIIVAYVENRTRHVLRSIIENNTLKTHNDASEHWKGNHGEGFPSNREKIETVIADYNKSPDTPYVYVHAWYFTPFSFQKIINVLNKLAYIQFNIEKIYNTLYKKNEFWVILKKI
jgi:SAM-dependent methyltransferase